MYNQKLKIYADNFEKLTEELQSPRDNTFFLALFIHELTKQLHDTVRLHKVQSYEGLRCQVEENLLGMQQETETKHAIICTMFFCAHPELKGLEWQAPLVQEPWSRHQWKREQRLAHAYSPSYPPPCPTAVKRMCMPMVLNHADGLEYTSNSTNVYMCNRKSVTMKVYLQTKDKKATNYALIDSGVTENFMSLHYAKYLHMPIKKMPEPQMMYNVDGSPNKSGGITHYVDLNI